MARKELEHFQDILFHYNPYEDLWYAFNRSDANSYFSARDSIKTLNGPSLNSLVSAISKGMPIE